jgi:acyl-CoA thioesterase FadM
MKGDNYHFTLDFSVRDYECDLQGIVNNGKPVVSEDIDRAAARFLKSR